MDDEYIKSSEQKLEEHVSKHKDEVEARYGYINHHGKHELGKISEEASKIFLEISKLMDLDPSDPQVQKLIKEWQDFISNNFYSCTNEILKSLGEMYIADDRFNLNLDKIKPGLALFISKAIEIYCKDKII